MVYDVGSKWWGVWAVFPYSILFSRFWNFDFMFWIMMKIIDEFRISKLISYSTTISKLQFQISISCLNFSLIRSKLFFYVFVKPNKSTNWLTIINGVYHFLNHDKQQDFILWLIIVVLFYGSGFVFSCYALEFRFFSYDLGLRFLIYDLRLWFLIYDLELWFLCHGLEFRLSFYCLGCRFVFCKNIEK